MTIDPRKTLRSRLRQGLSLLVLLASAGPVLAASTAPEPPPSPAQIKACIEQFDIGRHWRFDWKRVDIGPPRHPRNNLEAMAPFGGQPLLDRYGYPIHLIYSINGTEIDAVYWLMRNAQGAWQIPAICQLP